MVVICGIDEAGKGPVIGPLVICAATIDKSKEGELKKLGVKDSKLLSPMKRKELFGELKTIVKYKVAIVSVEDIDLAIESSNSNIIKLEAQRSAYLLNNLEHDEAYIDCPSANTESYERLLAKQLKKEVRLVCEHKADYNYLIVAAASIIAKYTRDHEIEKLKKKYKVDFGSGYPSDPYTKKFLQNSYKNFPFFRKSWASWKNVAKQNGQRKLGQF